MYFTRTGNEQIRTAIMSFANSSLTIRLHCQNLPELMRSGRFILVLGIHSVSVWRMILMLLYTNFLENSSGDDSGVRNQSTWSHSFGYIRSQSV